MVPILVSANYLMMDELVEACLQFFILHINEILLLSIDLASINEKLIGKIALLISDYDFDVIHQRFRSDLWNDALSSIEGKRVPSTRIVSSRLLHSIWKHKLKNLLLKPEYSLRICRSCKLVYSISQQDWAVCPSSIGTICSFCDVCVTDRVKGITDYYGNNKRNHEEEPDWNINLYFANLVTNEDPDVKIAMRLRSANSSTNGKPKTGASKSSNASETLKFTWNELYWHAWGFVHSMFCIICNKHFIAHQYDQCQLTGSKSIELLKIRLIGLRVWKSRCQGNIASCKQWKRCRSI